MAEPGLQDILASLVYRQVVSLVQHNVKTSFKPQCLFRSIFKNTNDLKMEALLASVSVAI